MIHRTDGDLGPLQAGRYPSGQTVPGTSLQEGQVDRVAKKCFENQQGKLRLTRDYSAKGHAYKKNSRFMKYVVRLAMHELAGYGIKNEETEIFVAGSRITPHCQTTSTAELITNLNQAKGKLLIKTLHKAGMKVSSELEEQCIQVLQNEQIPPKEKVRFFYSIANLVTQEKEQAKETKKQIKKIVGDTEKEVTAFREHLDRVKEALVTTGRNKFIDNLDRFCNELAKATNNKTFQYLKERDTTDPNFAILSKLRSDPKIQEGWRYKAKFSSILNFLISLFRPGRPLSFTTFEKMPKETQAPKRHEPKLTYQEIPLYTHEEIEGIKGAKGEKNAHAIEALQTSQRRDLQDILFEYSVLVAQDPETRNQEKLAFVLGELILSDPYLSQCEDTNLDVLETLHQQPEVFLPKVSLTGNEILNEISQQIELINRGASSFMEEKISDAIEKANRDMLNTQMPEEEMEGVKEFLTTNLPLLQKKLSDGEIESAVKGVEEVVKGAITFGNKKMSPTQNKDLINYIKEQFPDVWKQAKNEMKPLVQPHLLKEAIGGLLYEHRMGHIAEQLGM